MHVCVENFEHVVAATGGLWQDEISKKKNVQRKFSALILHQLYNATYNIEIRRKAMNPIKASSFMLTV